MYVFRRSRCALSSSTAMPLEELLAASVSAACAVPCKPEHARPQALDARRQSRELLGPIVARARDLMMTALRLAELPIELAQALALGPEPRLVVALQVPEQAGRVRKRCFVRISSLGRIVRQLRELRLHRRRASPHVSCSFAVPSATTSSLRSIACKRDSSSTRRAVIAARSTLDKLASMLGSRCTYARWRVSRMSSNAPRLSTQRSRLRFTYSRSR